jgi:hypothetical protein
MRLERIHAQPGCRYEVHLLLDDRGRSSVRDIIREAQPQEKDSFNARVIRLAEVGPEATPHYDMVDARNGIWKMHASKHIRIYCFREGHRFILCSAERKTKRQDDPKSLPRAIALRQRYFDETE